MSARRSIWHGVSALSWSEHSHYLLHSPHATIGQHDFDAAGVNGALGQESADNALGAQAGGLVLLLHNADTRARVDITANWDSGRLLCPWSRLLVHEPEKNGLWLVCCVEMAADGVWDLPSQGGEIVGLDNDGFADGSGYASAFRRLLYFEY